MTEEEVKLRLINPALQQAGWNLVQIGMERKVYIYKDIKIILSNAKERIVEQDTQFSGEKILFEDNKIKRAAKKSCDYILSSIEGRPLAIIEAKNDSHTIHDGLQQAMEYARAFGVHFAYSSNGQGFKEFDFFTGKQRKLKLNEFPSEEELLERFYKGRANASKELEDLQENIQNLEKKILEKPDNEKELIEELENLKKELEKFDYRDLIGDDYKELFNKPFDLSENKPRYYQVAAVNKALEAIAAGQRRILLVMATGTGKTRVAYELINRLFKAGKIKRVLYLADRNILIEQTLKNDFKSLAKEATTIKKRVMDVSHPLCFGLYQQFIEYIDKDSIEYFLQKDSAYYKDKIELTRDEEDNILKTKIAHYKEYARNFFDFILVDECHRSSAREESAYKEILEYFNEAIQVGMTATPRHKMDGSNLDYFGHPVYYYSLAQGIDDGFLAPYKVEQHTLNISQSVVFDKENKEKRYILDRIKEVARYTTDFLKNKFKNRFYKTIVFCSDQYHAALMRDALIEQNNDLMAQSDGHYCVRITSDDGEVGKEYLENFIRPESKYPVIATTSKLLSTGVDTKTLKLIVLDTHINSLTEFMQILGRGTRLYEGKSYFSILDFAGSSERHFNDLSFDKIPRLAKGYPPEPKSIPTKEIKKLEIEGKIAYIMATKVMIVDENGKIRIISYEDFTKENLQRLYPNFEDFLKEWNQNLMKENFIEQIEKEGILIQELRGQKEFKDKDELDILLFLAVGKTPITRKERAKKLNKFLDKYQGKVREFLEVLIDKYTKHGITDIENPKVFQTKPFEFTNLSKSLNDIFGSIDNYKKTIIKFKEVLYSA